MGTLCLHQNLRTLQDNKECVQNCKYNDILSSSLVSHNYVNYLGSFSPTRALHLSMKLLWVRVRKSTRAVVHTPASEVVGIRYSIIVLSSMTAA